MGKIDNGNSFEFVNCLFYPLFFLVVLLGVCLLYFNTLQILIGNYSIALVTGIVWTCFNLRYFKASFILYLLGYSLFNSHHFSHSVYSYLTYVSLRNLFYASAIMSLVCLVFQLQELSEITSLVCLISFSISPLIYGLLASFIVIFIYRLNGFILRQKKSKSRSNRKDLNVFKSEKGILFTMFLYLFVFICIFLFITPPNIYDYYAFGGIFSALAFNSWLNGKTKIPYFVLFIIYVFSILYYENTSINLKSTALGLLILSLLSVVIVNRFWVNLTYSQLMESSLILSTLILSLGSMLKMLIFYNDVDSIGPSMAVIILSLFYMLMFFAMYFLPQKRCKDAINSIMKYQRFNLFMTFGLPVLSVCIPLLSLLAIISLLGLSPDNSDYQSFKNFQHYTLVILSVFILFIIQLFFVVPIGSLKSTQR